jgi:hypothetical protein
MKQFLTFCIHTVQLWFLLYTVQCFLRVGDGAPELEPHKCFFYIRVTVQISYSSEAVSNPLMRHWPLSNAYTLKQAYDKYLNNHEAKILLYSD